MKAKAAVDGLDRALAARKAVSSEYRQMSERLDGWLAAAHEEPKHVLVIDDDPDWRALLDLEMGDKDGITIRHMASAVLALELCRSQAFDAIVVDLLLPGMSGVEFIAELRHESLRPLVPVVVMTGLPVAIAEEAACRAGANVAVPKDAGTPAIAAAIRAVLT